MRAHYLAQGGLQQVRGAVIALNLGPAGVVVAGRELGVEVLGQLQHGMHDEVIFLLRVQHAHLAERTFQKARVTNLPTRLGVERRLIEHQLILGFALAVGAAVAQDAGRGLLLVVAHKGRLLLRLTHHGPVALIGFLGVAAAAFLQLQLLLEAFLVHGQAFFAGNEGRKVQREAKRVRELKGGFAVYFIIACPCVVLKSLNSEIVIPH